MGRNENIEIFKDTEKQVKNNETIKASVKASVKASTNKQKIILEDDTIDLEKKEKKSALAKVIVSQKRTFEAASKYKGMKTVVHNFASATNPGGGVVRGANAQEECLCRCSGLYFNLNEQNMWDGFYRPHRVSRDPLHNDDIIFTPDYGYEIPNIVFWNVNSRHDVFHADYTRNSVQLCSGQSVTVFKQLLESIGSSPIEMMEKVINSERYSCLSVSEKVAYIDRK